MFALFVWYCMIYNFFDIQYIYCFLHNLVNVSTQSFKDAQHRELLFDRQQLMKGKMHIGESNDNRGDDWRKPLPIEDLEDLVVPGCNR